MTRRRWYQFSLRTMLLLVTISAVWLAWELNYVRQRKACIAAVRAVGQVVSCATNEEWAAQAGTVHEPFKLPWWRRLMGDEAMESFWIYDTSPELSRGAMALFPEAVVMEMIGVGTGRYRKLQSGHPE